MDFHISHELISILSSPWDKWAYQIPWLFLQGTRQSCCGRGKGKLTCSGKLCGIVRTSLSPTTVVCKPYARNILLNNGFNRVRRRLYDFMWILECSLRHTLSSSRLGLTVLNMAKMSNNANSTKRIEGELKLWHNKYSRVLKNMF